MSSSGSSTPSFTKWLQLKIYQVEVTFSVYIFTPLEKFIFCMLLFSLTPPCLPSLLNLSPFPLLPNRPD